MEVTGSRNPAQLDAHLRRLEADGVFLPDVDRHLRWVRLPRGRGRRRLYLFALPDTIALGRRARALAFDERMGTGPEVVWADPYRR